MPSAITLDSSVQASTEQVSCEVTPDVVILNLKNGEYYGMNEVGARIWRLLQEPRTVAEIRDHVVEAYPDVTPEQCTLDLLSLLEDLAASSLIEVVVSAKG